MDRKENDLGSKAPPQLILTQLQQTVENKKNKNI